MCTSATDTACYGDYYQWGRGYDGHQSSSSLTTAIQATDINNAGTEFIQGSPDWASVDGTGTARQANWEKIDGSSVCPVGFRVPTLAELQAETLDNGVSNTATAFSNFLKLPSAGYRAYTTANLMNVDTSAYIWANAPSGSSSRNIAIGSSSANTGNDGRAFGFSVRCIEKITHNGTSYGTVTSPYTGKVWLDRNLGASKVCSSSTDTQCYGDYYQWGRGYDGHQESTSATTATLATDVNAAGSSFIKSTASPYDWASVDGVGTIRTANWSATDGSSVCPTGFRVPTLAELKAETLDNGVTDSATAFSNFLKLPSAGGRNNGSGTLYGQGSWGNVWTSSVNGSSSHGIYFGSSGAYTVSSGRAYGYTVRCLRD